MQPDQDGVYWFTLDVNPEPWAIGDLSVGRKGGKMYPMVGRNHQLHNYKMAVKEAMGEPGIWFEKVDLELQCYFWRRMDEYTSPQQRGARSHEADTTNLFKATEDALQGILYKNDKDVKHTHGRIMAQGPNVNSCVLIGINLALPGSLPAGAPLGDVAAIVDAQPPDNSWG